MTATPRTESPIKLAGCTCARLRKLTRRMSQSYDLHLAAVGLRITQYSLLSNLAHNEGVTITSLARTLGMDRTTLVRNLKPLEQAGFVAQGAGARGNERAVSLTAEGRAVLQRAREKLRSLVFNATTAKAGFQWQWAALVGLLVVALAVYFASSLHKPKPPVEGVSGLLGLNTMSVSSTMTESP